jgi:hypothetical protein
MSRNGFYTTRQQLIEENSKLTSERNQWRAQFVQVFNFLNSIEGAGYGGMAEFEIARETMRRASVVTSQDQP